MPFDWKNPLGYAIAVLLEYMIAVYLFLIITTMLCAGIEGLLLAKAVLDDLKSYLIKINKNGKSKKKHLEATEQLTDFLQAHTLLIQFCS